MTSNPAPTRRTLLQHLGAGASGLAGTIPDRVYITLVNGSGAVR
jgi:hypothetical protein